MPFFKDYMIGLSTNAPTVDDWMIFYNNSDSTEYKSSISNIPLFTWQTYTPTLSWTSGSGATMTVTSARYASRSWTASINIEGVITSKWTCAWDFRIFAPTTSTSWRNIVISWWVYASWGITNRGIPFIDTTNWLIKLISSAPSTILNWSAISVGDYIFISWFYEI